MAREGEGREGRRSSECLSRCGAGRKLTSSRPSNIPISRYLLHYACKWKVRKSQGNRGVVMEGVDGEESEVVAGRRRGG